MKKQQFTMAVVRGRREAVVEFYQHFERMKVLFLAGGDKKGYSHKNFKYIGLPFEPRFWLNPIQPKNKIYNNLSLINIKGLEKLINKAQVLNLTDLYYFFNLQAVKIAKKLPIPVVTIIWTTIPNHITTWLPPYSFNAKTVIKATDLFILRSKTALAFTDSLGINRQKVKVIYKGVDLKLFFPRRKKLLGKIKIVFAGHLHKDKGLYELVGAFANLCQRYDNLELLIAGQGPLKNFLWEKSKHLPIKLFGHLEHQNLAKFYRQGDIFCSPSKIRYLGFFKIWEEYFAYTLMEAQASGLPIVATKTGGISEEVDDKNFLVEPNRPDQLFWALERLIVDDKLRQILGKINRKRAEKLFDAQKQALKTEKAILDLLKK